jgi:hypothetical protein
MTNKREDLIKIVLFLPRAIIDSASVYVTTITKEEINDSFILAHAHLDTPGLLYLNCNSNDSNHPLLKSFKLFPMNMRYNTPASIQDFLQESKNITTADPDRLLAMLTRKGGSHGAESRKTIILDVTDLFNSDTQLGMDRTGLIFNSSETISMTSVRNMFTWDINYISIVVFFLVEDLLDIDIPNVNDLPVDSNQDVIDDLISSKSTIVRIDYMGSSFIRLYGRKVLDSLRSGLLESANGYLFSPNAVAKISFTTLVLPSELRIFRLKEKAGSNYKLTSNVSIAMFIQHVCNNYSIDCKINYTS